MQPCRTRHRWSLDNTVATQCVVLASVKSVVTDTNSIIQNRKNVGVLPRSCFSKHVSSFLSGIIFYFYCCIFHCLVVCLYVSHPVTLSCHPISFPHHHYNCQEKHSHITKNYIHWFVKSLFHLSYHQYSHLYLFILLNIFLFIYSLTLLIRLMLCYSWPSPSLTLTFYTISPSFSLSVLSLYRRPCTYLSPPPPPIFALTKLIPLALLLAHHLLTPSFLTSQTSAT